MPTKTKKPPQETAKPSTVVTNGLGEVGRILDQITFKDDTYPFVCKVGVCKMSAPRHERFEYIRDMGSAFLDAIFNDKPNTLSGDLTFIFPERWMSVHEQHAFTYRLTRHPDVAKITSVMILTSSPMIVSGFRRESVRIITWEDDHKHDGGVLG